MQRYTIIKKIGIGAFGVVWMATHNATGETVAIKKMKQHFNSWEECLQLREIQSLRRLQHANVIKLKEVIRENTELCMVFEFMDQNIYQITRQRVEQMSDQNPFNEKEIRSILCQTLLGLQYVHKNGFFHRDLKPENLLTKGDVVKIADFGLAKEIRSRPPFTEYVSTRWYRAPEIILRSTHYNSPIDIWALGVIMVELYCNRPLFPGSSDPDQLFKICSVLGAPSPNEWEEGHQLARKVGIRFPQVSPTPLKQIIPHASAAALDLLESMLQFNPQARPTATMCLQHAFVTGGSSMDSGMFGGSASATGLFQGIHSRAPHNPFHLAAGLPATGATSSQINSRSGAPTPISTSPIQTGTLKPTTTPNYSNPAGYSSSATGLMSSGNTWQHSSGEIPSLRSTTPNALGANLPYAQTSGLQPMYSSSADPYPGGGSQGGWHGGTQQSNSAMPSARFGTQPALPPSNYSTNQHQFVQPASNYSNVSPGTSFTSAYTSAAYTTQPGFSTYHSTQPAPLPSLVVKDPKPTRGFASYTDDDTNF